MSSFFTQIYFILFNITHFYLGKHTHTHTWVISMSILIRSTFCCFRTKVRSLLPYCVCESLLLSGVQSVHVQVEGH